MRPPLRRLPWALLGTALLCAAAFWQPSLPLTRPRFELVVVLDITQSMNTADMLDGGRPVSRLAFARRALHEALPALPCGSKLGWAVFTEARSYLLLSPVEVCANRAELRASLDRIESRMAWSGNSEITKGLHSARTLVRELPDHPALVFITDGQEAPPLEPRFRPHFDDKPGEVAGLVVGVGASRLSPIPKTDPSGRPIGFWSAEEVAQQDPRSQGRGSSVGGEALLDEKGRADGSVASGLGATPGSEHLSSLREGYLRQLAGEGGYGYLRLEDGEGLANALRAPAFARPLATQFDARVLLAALALVLLCAPYLTTLWRRVRAV